MKIEPVLFFYTWVLYRFHKIGNKKFKRKVPATWI